MRFQRKNRLVIVTAVAGLLSLTYCTKDNKVTLPSEDVNSATDLLSLKVTAGPSVDGAVDAIWDQATKLEIIPTVPDPGNNLFTGYIGEQHPVTLRSLYDGQYIYFLAEYADESKSVNVSPWYFNADSNRWYQEPSARTFDVNGILTRDGWGEDKIAMLWNIDFSTPKFITSTCYASCHVFTPYTDYSGASPVYKSNASSGNHYTNGVNEKIDMWWGHLSRDVLFNQMDDNYQDWAGGPAVTSLTGGNANGRHVDDLVVTGTSTTWPNRPTYSTALPQGALNNRQNLKLDGTGSTVTVPLWVMPGATDYYYISASDTASGKAVKITGVSSTGVLSYNGGAIDPNVGGDYKRSGDPVFGGIGAKCIPSYIASPLINGRADIDCAAVYTGSGWIVEYRRLLKTSDALKQDVDFSSLDDQQFGFAVWDRSNYQHAIQPNLVLKFQK
ncbi:MAG TPA: ethylbenzene dehydrogenase-related protein [Panacibacter sp.]|nr:ethylbenzene dehydrogenase-related protein [Panacibacter sp.]HNP45702.1 ethylbenzene dehydrogenase-related protein [Panacibacter sp.]